MNKTTNTLLCFLLLAMLCVNAQGKKKQGFDDDTEDNWAYTSNIPFYTENNASDVWTKYSNANGRIPGPFGGANYLACRDLDNPYSQQYTGLESPEHILTFETTNISGMSAEISFRYHYVGLNMGDYVYFQLRFDNGTDWYYADYEENIFRTSQTGSFNSRGWDYVNYSVPSGYNHVRMRLVIYQNGNEYLGFDNFELNMATLSNKHNLIEGFSYGPNPTYNSLSFRANVELDAITIYNVLGKEVFKLKGNSRNLNVDLSNQASGVYLAKIEAGNIIETLKIIKK